MPSVWFWETTLFLLGISHRVLKMWKQFKGGVGLYFSRSDSSDQGEVLVKLADFRSFARRDDKGPLVGVPPRGTCACERSRNVFHIQNKVKEKGHPFRRGFLFSFVSFFV